MKMREDPFRDATNECLAALEESVRRLRDNAGDGQAELLRELEQILVEIRQSTGGV